jgi:5,10-methylenetetrahydromethanopterin reductase
MISMRIGLSPARYMEEYLAVLHPLFSEGRIDFAGQVFSIKAELCVQDSSPFPVLLAALAPRMLRLAGEKANGTVTWMAGRHTIESHIVPRLYATAQAVRRPQPRVCVGWPIAVTDDESQGREYATKDFSRYGQLVNYRRLLEIEGVTGPADVAVVGNQRQVEQQLRAFAPAGATDFLAAIFPAGENPDASIARTWNLLKNLNGTL